MNKIQLLYKSNWEWVGGYLGEGQFSTYSGTASYITWLDPPWTSRRIWLIRVLVSDIGPLRRKCSYFRPFTVKIRSFAIYGALNPPKCPNKPKNDTFKIICRKLKSNNSTISDFCQSCLLNRATGCPGLAKFESCQIAL